MRRSVLFQLFSLFGRKAPVFVWAISYYIVLFFAYSNLSYLVATVVFFLILYILLRDLRQATFLMFIATLPFAKGKELAWIIVPREQIPQFGLFDIGYYFPLYPSVVFLVVSLYLALRKTRFFPLQKHISSVASSFLILLLVSSVPLVYSPFPVVVGLSVVQLVLMGGIFWLPSALRMNQNVRFFITQILSGFILFQTGWILIQVINRGPLGRYLEATLPLNRLGILSTEDPGLMRYNGTFFEPSILGTFMLMHFFYFTAILLYQKGPKPLLKNIYALTVISAGISIIFTGSRGIYALFLVLSVMFYRKNKDLLLSNQTAGRFIRIAAIACLVVLLALSPYVIKRLQSAVSLFSEYGSGTYRVQLNNFSLRLASAHPFGVGLNLSPYYIAYGFPQERWVDPTHPHNLFFQLVAETGFIGLAAFLVFVWLLYKGYLTKPTVKSAPYFMASAAFLLAAQFYPIFISQPEIVSFFFLHAGVMNWTLENNAS